MRDIAVTNNAQIYSRDQLNSINNTPNNANPESAANNVGRCNKVFALKMTAIISAATIVIVIGSVALYRWVKDDVEDCDEGFFRPVDDNDDLICYECILENCKNCEGKKEDNTCTQCKDGFGAKYTEGVITECAEIKDPNFQCGDNCESDGCDIIDQKCVKCKSGYFVPDNSNTKWQCEKCSLDRCDQCEGNRPSDICISCKDEFIPKYDANEQITQCNDLCQIGDTSHCKECDYGENECITCESGYYIPSDDNIKLECKQCSLENCQFCHGTKNSNTCDSCNVDKIAKIVGNNIISCDDPPDCEIGPDDKCLTCSETEKGKCATCNLLYKLDSNGECKLEVIETTPINGGYMKVTAKYSTDIKTSVPVIGSGKNYFIKQMKVDNGNVLSSNIPVDYNGNYVFGASSSKVHTIEFNLEINSNILQGLFSGVGILTSVVFNEVNNENNVEISSMNNMFYSCANLISVDISKIDTKDVINMNSMFSNCYSLKEVDLSQKTLTKVITANELFKNCGSITSINLNTAFTKLQNFNQAFYNCSIIKSLDLSQMQPTKIIDMYQLFCRCFSIISINLNNFDTQYAVNMYGTFHYCSNLTSVDLSNFKTNSATNLKWMFFNCSKLVSLDLSSFDTSQVTDMKELCYKCTSLTSINFGNNFKTNLVTDMSHMFYECKKLKSIDLSGFRTPKVISFVNMFCYCSSLTSLDFSTFDFTESGKHYVGPPIIQYCSSLKYLNMQTINFMIFRDFFFGIPEYGGQIFVSRTLYYQLLSMGIKVLTGWTWKIYVP